jgi:hypothetical protein
MSFRNIPKRRKLAQPVPADRESSPSPPLFQKDTGPVLSFMEDVFGMTEEEFYQTYPGAKAREAELVTKFSQASASDEMSSSATTSGTLQNIPQASASDVMSSSATTSGTLKNIPQASASDVMSSSATTSGPPFPSVSASGVGTGSAEQN